MLGKGAFSTVYTSFNRHHEKLATKVIPRQNIKCKCNNILRIVIKILWKGSCFTQEVQALAHCQFRRHSEIEIEFLYFPRVLRRWESRGLHRKKYQAPWDWSAQAIRPAHKRNELHEIIEYYTSWFETCEYYVKKWKHQNCGLWIGQKVFQRRAYENICRLSFKYGPLNTQRPDLYR